MTKFHQEHRAYKFQIAVCVVFHKAVDPAVITQPPVALTSEMVAVYADVCPPLEDVYRQLLNFIEVCEHTGSNWVFSNFASLQLTLWDLDPLCASAFLPLPQWVREKKAVVNVTGTGDDCFKWAVLAGMYPVGKHEHPNRMSKYGGHANKYHYLLLFHLLRQTIYLSMCMLECGIPLGVRRWQIITISICSWMCCF